LQRKQAFPNEGRGMARGDGLLENKAGLNAARVVAALQV
jgi:hypothetical protein